MNSSEKENKDFLRIVSVSSALAFGALAASLQSFQATTEGLQFQLGFGTFIALILGAAAGAAYWQLLYRMQKKGESSGNGARTKTKVFSAASALLLLAGIFAFLYPLRFVSPEKLKEITIGLLLAALFLGMVAWLGWNAVRFFNEEPPETTVPPSPEQISSPTTPPQPSPPDTTFPNRPLSD